MSEQIDELLNRPLVVINIGLDGFAASLEDQRIDVLRVDWRPPAGGDKEMIDILDQLL